MIKTTLKTTLESLVSTEMSDVHKYWLGKVCLTWWVGWGRERGRGSKKRTAHASVTFAQVVFTFFLLSLPEKTDFSWRWSFITGFIVNPPPPPQKKSSDKTTGHPSDCNKQTNKQINKTEESKQVWYCILNTKNSLTGMHHCFNRNTSVHCLAAFHVKEIRRIHQQHVSWKSHTLLLVKPVYCHTFP